MHEKSFHDIYTSYYKRVFLFVKSYIHDGPAAEDITSDSFIKLWEQMKEETVDEIHALPWLFTILKNKSLDYLKHEEVKRTAFESMADWQKYELAIRISALEACNPDDFFSKEVRNIVDHTLEQFSEQTKRIFVLSRFENKTNHEIAEIMNISVKGVEYHMSKVLKALRIALKDYLSLLYFFLCNS